jgi:hypothetical protein
MKPTPMYQVFDTVYRRPIGQPMFNRSTADLYRAALCVGFKSRTRFKILRVSKARVIARAA